MLHTIKYLVLCFLISNLSAYAQKVNVTANIPTLKDKEVTIDYFAGKKPTSDKIAVIDGKFKWTAAIAAPQMVHLNSSNEHYQFFVEPGNISITSANAGELILKGSKTQDEYESYLKTQSDLDSQITDLHKSWKRGSDQEQADLETRIDEVRKQAKVRANRYITDNPNSFVSLHLVTYRAMIGDYSDIKPIFEKLTNRLKPTREGKELAERLAVLKRSDIGQPMLDFIQKDPEGKAIKFADFKGKYVLIDFWASWCEPCRGENPNVLKAYDQYKAKNFTVIGISLDDKAEKWEKAIKDDKMPWTQVSDLKGFDNEIASYYGIRAIPCTFLINPGGKIIATYLRGSSLNKKLAEIFD